ncbi:MmgE/PrpD family protein [Actinophytocola gossypii]|uniref:MmgE/PrpD family protein n=1 Tax=Actinophytocola gossypii TaxID=2812003 RepID=A0ABT2J139_9PSEU|nr:MmgE/PrpD family protein [Actinophytocola gossypii]MCT2581579.1 MmgE/PrpD family protein [Actinophytocola gossypii]
MTATPTTRALAAFAAGLSYPDLPDAVVAKAGALLVDFVGAAVGGATTAEVSTLTDLVRARGGAPTATVLGAGFAAPAADAAYCNGAAADVFEHQDGYRFGGFHPSHTLPALLAVAEETDADLRALLTAAVVAYEVSDRIGRAVHPNATRAGWFPIAATFGAAAGCAKLLGLPEERIADAVGAAAFFAPAVLIESIFAGPSAKPAFAGQLARAGVEGAQHAAAGLTGWREVVEHPRGLVAVLGGTPPAATDDGLDGLGSEWTILDVHQKRFAGCRHTHGAAQAAVELAVEHDLDPERITAVDVETYDIALLLVDRPVGPDPSTVACTLSLPYVVGAAVADRDVGGAQYGQATRTDPRVLRVADLVRLRPAADLEARYPEYTATRVTITTDDGAAHTRTVDVPAGDSRAPLTRDQLLAKFAGYVGSAFGERIAAGTAELLLAPPAGAPVRDLTGQLATRPQEHACPT